MNKEGEFMKYVVMALLIVFAQQSFAKSKGSDSIGGFFGSAGSTQDDLNTVINAANTRSTITTGRLTSGYELAFQITFRITSLALQFRPSYMWSSVTGTGTGGAFNYSVSGFTFFPILKWYMLEDKYIKFFTQFGMGYGAASGKIEEAGASVSFSGSNMGFMGGLGAEFCFSKGKHCIVLEGNYRYLPFVRNLVDSTSGTFDSGSVDTPVSGQELEYNNVDLSTTFSGILANLGYSYSF